MVAPLTDHSGLGFHFNVDYRHSAHDEGKFVITREKYKNSDNNFHVKPLYWFSLVFIRQIYVLSFILSIDNTQTHADNKGSWDWLSFAITTIFLKSWHHPDHIILMTCWFIKVFWSKECCSLFSFKVSSHHYLYLFKTSLTALNTLPASGRSIVERKSKSFTNHDYKVMIKYNWRILAVWLWL